MMLNKAVSQQFHGGSVNPLCLIVPLSDNWFDAGCTGREQRLRFPADIKNLWLGNDPFHSTLHYRNPWNKLRIRMQLFLFGEGLELKLKVKVLASE